MHYQVPDIRLRCFDSNDFKHGNIAKTRFTVHDVVHIPSVYNIETYMSLLNELETANINSKGKLLNPWHKANHLIANDKHRGGAWKNECPTFQAIIDDISQGFNITANATRVNIYRSGENGRWGHSETKPWHHDRSAKTPGLSQNITVGVSLGCDRELAFKHAKKKKSPDDKWYNIRSGAVVSTVCNSGSIYAFSRDVNCEFQHAVLPVHGQFGANNDFDRVSIIVWGTSYTMDVADSRVSKSNIPSSRELGVSDRGYRKFDSTN
jgi:hypothetical protein